MDMKDPFPSVLSAAALAIRSTYHRRTPYVGQFIMCVFRSTVYSRHKILFFIATNNENKNDCSNNHDNDRYYNIRSSVEERIHGRSEQQH
jgi:hypothetical protein